MGYVGEKFLAHQFQPLSARNIKKDAQRAVSSVSIRVAQRQHPQIVNLTLWTMNLHLDTVTLDSLERVQKGTVDSRIPCQFSETLRLELRRRKIEQLECSFVRSDDPHVAIHHQQTFTHALKGRFEQIAYGKNWSSSLFLTCDIGAI